MPFLQLATQGAINGFQGDGWPAAAALLLPAAMAIFGDRPEGFTPPAALLAIAASGLAVVFAAFKLADATRAADAAAGSIGLGTWLLLFATIVALLGSALSLTKRLG